MLAIQFFLADLPEIGLISVSQNFDTSLMKTIHQVLADFLILRVSESSRQFEIQPVMQPMSFAAVIDVLDHVGQPFESDRNLFASFEKADGTADSS